MQLFAEGLFVACGDVDIGGGARPGLTKAELDADTALDDGVAGQQLGNDDARDEEPGPLDGDVQLAGDGNEALVKLRGVDRRPGVLKRVEARDGLVVADGFPRWMARWMAGWLVWVGRVAATGQLARTSCRLRPAIAPMISVASTSSMSSRL